MTALVNASGIIKEDMRTAGLEYSDLPIELGLLLVLFNLSVMLAFEINVLKYFFKKRNSTAFRNFISFYAFLFRMFSLGFWQQYLCLSPPPPFLSLWAAVVSKGMLYMDSKESMLRRLPAPLRALFHHSVTGPPMPRKKSGSRGWLCPAECQKQAWKFWGCVQSLEPWKDMNTKVCDKMFPALPRPFKSLPHHTKFWPLRPGVRFCVSKRHLSDRGLPPQPPKRLLIPQRDSSQRT